jgi:hypothetical protein
VGVAMRMPVPAGMFAMQLVWMGVGHAIGSYP